MSMIANLTWTGNCPSGSYKTNSTTGQIGCMYCPLHTWPSTEYTSYSSSSSGPNSYPQVGSDICEECLPTEACSYGTKTACSTRVVQGDINGLLMEWCENTGILPSHPNNPVNSASSSNTPYDKNMAITKNYLVTFLIVFFGLIIVVFIIVRKKKKNRINDSVLLEAGLHQQITAPPSVPEEPTAMNINKIVVIQTTKSSNATPTILKSDLKAASSESLIMKKNHSKRFSNNSMSGLLEVKSRMSIKASGSVEKVSKRLFITRDETPIINTIKEDHEIEIKKEKIDNVKLAPPPTDDRISLSDVEL